MAMYLTVTSCSMSIVKAILKKPSKQKGTVDSIVNLCTDIFIIKTARLIEALKEGQQVGATPNLGQFLREMIAIEKHWFI